MYLYIGPWRIGVRAEGGIGGVSPALAAFVGADSAKADFHLNYSFASAPFGKSSELKLEIRGTEHSIRGRSMRAHWDSESPEVQVETWSKRIRSFTPDLRNPLMSALQVIATERLRSRGGFFFHAASLKVADGLTVLVPGVSETGKTTFASGPWVEKLFTDEHSLVDFSEGGARVHGVPFSGREKLVPSPGSAELNLLLFIEKGHPGEEPELKSIPAKQARERLLRSLICFDKRPEVFAGNIQRIQHLVETLPSVIMRYSPDRGNDAVAYLKQSRLAA